MLPDKEYSHPLHKLPVLKVTSLEQEKLSRLCLCKKPRVTFLNGAETKL